MKEFDDGGRESDVELFAGQLIRRAVVVTIDLKMGIGGDSPAGQPVGVLVASGRQRLERRSVKRLELGAARTRELFERMVIEIIEQ